MKQQVFYCWQTDSPTTTNRFFIRAALRLAIEQLNETSPVELVFDEATEEVQGLVEIPEHIRNKLETCSIFVMDLTIVGKVSLPGSNKVQPNSNVLFEAGYVLAMMRRRRLEPPPVVVVMNTKYGHPSQLPFDLGWRPVVSYSLDEGTALVETKQQCHNMLTGRLRQALLSIIDGGQLFAGLSPPAWQLGAFLIKAPYEEGRSSYYTAEELRAGTELSLEEVKEGAAELMDRGLLTELQVMGAEKGWPVVPRETLFILLDPFLTDWNPEEDARQILQDLGSSEGTQISAHSVQERYGWELRRLEPALAWLVHNILAEDMGERRPPYQRSRLQLTRKANLFMRKRFDPGALRRRS